MYFWCLYYSIFYLLNYVIQQIKPSKKYKIIEVLASKVAELESKALLPWQGIALQFKTFWL